MISLAEVSSIIEKQEKINYKIKTLTNTTIFLIKNFCEHTKSFWFFKETIERLVSETKVIKIWKTTEVNTSPHDQLEVSLNALEVSLKKFKLEKNFLWKMLKIQHTQIFMLVWLIILKTNVKCLGIFLLSKTDKGSN